MFVATANHSHSPLDDAQSDYFSGPEVYSDIQPSPLCQGDDTFIPECDKALRPQIGMVFDSIDEAYNFYKSYAAVCGFVSRRGTQTKVRDGTVKRKYFYCTRAGLCRGSHDSMRPNKSGKKRKSSSGRTDCPAYIRLRFDGPNRYIVADFVEAHNHGMVKGGASQFLNSNRKLSFPGQSLIVNCSKVNIGPVRTFNLSKQLAGGFENVGAQKCEYKNFSRDVIAFIGESDAQMVMDKLQHKKRICSEFYFEYAEEQGVLTKLFWADPISIRNFLAFGDVVSFDATYSTNK